MLVIIDYGMGNLGSVKNMFKKIGKTSIISSNKKDIAIASKLLLPGVGSFDKAMKNLQELDLVEIIKKKILLDKTPILGICLGMQLLTKSSEEGKLIGFGFVDARTNKFDFEKINETLPVPHMGWNRLLHKKESRIFENMPKNERFYFVHSYAVECKDDKDVLTTTDYGYKFVSSFEKDNIIGCQFHPEKSHKYGMQLFKNFVENY